MIYALVRWKTGENFGKYLVSETSWIKGFDARIAEIFNNPFEVMTARDMKLNVAHIIAVGESYFHIDTLKISLEMAEKTPNDSDLRMSNSDVDNQQSILKNASDLQEKLSSFERKYRDQRRDNNRFIIELKEKMDGMREIIQRLETSQPTGNKIVQQRYLSMMELWPKSGLMVDQYAMHLASRSSTVGQFVGKLLQHLFPLEVLLQSTRRIGDSSKKNLDHEIMNGLYKATAKMFPEVTAVEFDQAISSRIYYLRSKFSP